MSEETENWRRLSRRKALALTGASLIGGLAGCGGDDGDDTPTDGTTAPGEDTPTDTETDTPTDTETDTPTDTETDTPGEDTPTGTVPPASENNPIAEAYGDTYAWTTNIAWDDPVSIVEYEDATRTVTDNRGTDRTDWLPAIEAAMADHAGDSTVITFPEGTHYVSDTLELQDGIVLRGVTPQEITDATEDGYAPLTRLEFPEYVFDKEDPMPYEEAFKNIESADGVSNVGLVNLDINRAEVDVGADRNLVIYGIRTNNAATPGFSDPYQEPLDYMEDWQVFPYRFGTNINAGASENIIVANTRNNDFQWADSEESDNFEQPGYKIEWRPQAGDAYADDAIVALPPEEGEYTIEKRPFEFDYAAHYGIWASGTGLAMRDNWTYSTRRVTLFAEGNDSLIKDNVARDDPDKEAWVGATGERATWGGETLENRGLNVSDYNVTVEGNDLETHSHTTFQGYGTTDGEGFLLQFNDNPLSQGVDGMYVRNNTLNNYIGIFKVGNVDDLVIEGNEVTGQNNNAGGAQIYVAADTNGDPYEMNNARVRDNEIRGHILFRATEGGSDNEITGNTNVSDDVDGAINVSSQLDVDIEDNDGFTVNEQDWSSEY